MWGLVSARLERWNVSAPIAFVVLGLVVTHGPTTLVHFNLHSSAIRSLAEVALALVLFADASRVNVRQLRADLALPVRLLGIGLPLTIGAGAALAAGLFSGAGLWVAAAIGAIVAPTDAALGASIMEDERVPAGVRRVLNVESGLNDGIATPFVNLFLAGAATAEAVHGASSAASAAARPPRRRRHRHRGRARRRLASRPGPQAPLERARLPAAGRARAGALRLLRRPCWPAPTGSWPHSWPAWPSAPPSRRNDDEPLEFSEEAGTLMSLLVWFVFGAVMLVPGLDGATWRDVVFALLALTVVRMVPVALALAGTGLDRSTVAFVGWFGPRGLASVVFGLVAVDTLDPAEAKIVLAAVTVTVALSVLLHGVTASPLAARYGRVAARLHPERPEHISARPITTRSLQRARSARSRGNPA